MRIATSLFAISFLILSGSLVSAQERGAPPEGRKKVEVRKSSKADIAKGDINFDDLQFDIEKDAPFNDDLLNDHVKQLNGKKVKLSMEKSQELSEKYQKIDSVGERAYQVVMDLELADTKWKKLYWNHWHPAWLCWMKMNKILVWRWSTLVVALVILRCFLTGTSSTPRWWRLVDNM